MGTNTSPPEEERLAELRRYGILDTAPEEGFEELAQLAALVCASPIAVLDFVDSDRVWIKANAGFPAEELPRDRSFAARVIERQRLLTVPDASVDERFSVLPFVEGEPRVRFLASVPLLSPSGHALGTITVMDPRVRTLSADQAAALWSLSRQAVTLLEHRRNAAELRRTIEQRERAEESAREREELLRTFVDQMPAILWSIDRDCRLTSSTGAGLAALGLATNEVVGMTLQEYFGVDDDTFGPIAAHLVALRGEPADFQQNWKGHRLECHVTPMRDAEGGIVGVLGMALDVTERMWAEGALLEAEVKYQGLIETIPAVTYIDPLSEWDDSLYVSPQITELLGCSQEEWLTDPQFWRRHVHADDVDRVWDEYTHARDSGVPYEHEYRMIHVDGHQVWVSERAVVLRDPEGRPWIVQGVIIDITERKRVEEELERAWQRERQAAEHLRAVDEMKNLQLHAVSHDLRGPITAVLGSALVLERSVEELAEEKRELIHGITASARKLNRLVTDLLDLDRLERGIVEPDRHPTDVGELARRLVSELEVEDHPVDVDVQGGAKAPVDPVQVERILENLVLNAAKHTEPGTPIWVRVRREGGGTVIVVEDAGPGVPEDLREVIFEPFRQGGRGGGLGIGLSLVSGFAELHGGRAMVGDREGGGASFRVYLPDERERSGARSGGLEVGAS